MSRRKDRELLLRCLDGEARPGDLDALASRAELREQIEELRRIAATAEQLTVWQPRRDLVAAARAQLASQRPERAPRWPWVFGAIGAAGVAVMVAFVAGSTTADLSLEPASAGLRIAARSGEAWIVESGARRSASFGEPIGDGQRVETGVDGVVALAGAGVSLIIDVSSRVQPLDQSGTRVRVDRGVVVVTPSAEYGAVTLEAAGVQIVVKPGEVGVLVDERGAVVAACKTGGADLIGSDGTVALAAGEQSHAHDGRWQEPRPIASVLQLEIRPPAALAPGDANLELRGQTQPGAAVTVNGQPVQVDHNGNFVHRLTVGEGTAEIRVEARDALLRKSSRAVVVARQPRPTRPVPEPEPAEPRWDWTWQQPNEPG